MTAGRNLPWLGVALVLGGSVLVSCGQSPESQALASVVRSAQTAELNLEDFPSSYRRDGDGSTVLQSMLDAVEPSLSRYFSGPLLARKVSLEQSALRSLLAARAGGRVGGVSSLSMSEVQVTGKSARAQARATIWFKTAQFWYQNPRSFRPATNTLDLDLHFAKVEGGWKIDAETLRFAPGGGP